jgi:hypothetical protein
MTIMTRPITRHIRLTPVIVSGIRPAPPQELLSIAFGGFSAGVLVKVLFRFSVQRHGSRSGRMTRVQAS